MLSGAAAVVDVLSTPVTVDPTVGPTGPPPPRPVGADRDHPISQASLIKGFPVALSIENLDEFDLACAYHGKSPGEITGAFEAAGYKATAVVSKKSSSKTPPTVINVTGTKDRKLTINSIIQIEVHPGGGIHGGAYYRITTNSKPKFKLVDPATYVPPSTPERFKYIWVEGVDSTMPKGTDGASGPEKGGTP